MTVLFLATDTFQRTFAWTNTISTKYLVGKLKENHEDIIWYTHRRYTNLKKNKHIIIILKYSKRSYSWNNVPDFDRNFFFFFFIPILDRLLQINSLSSRCRVILRDDIDESTCKYRDKIVPCLQIIRPMKMISTMLAPCYILYTGERYIDVSFVIGFYR